MPDPSETAMRLAEVAHRAMATWTERPILTIALALDAADVVDPAGAERLKKELSDAKALNESLARRCQRLSKDLEVANTICHLTSLPEPPTHDPERDHVVRTVEQHLQRIINFSLRPERGLSDPKVDDGLIPLSEGEATYRLWSISDLSNQALEELRKLKKVV